MNRILIDVDSIVKPRGRNYLSGIGRTTLELLHGFEHIPDPSVDIVLLTQRLPDRGINSYSLHFPLLYIPLPGNAFAKKWVARMHLKELLYNYDILHIPHNYDTVANPSKTVVTIHDALFFSYPEAFLGHEFARNHFPGLANKCKAIVTCSQSSKSDIVHYMNVLPEKITVIPWGVSSSIFYLEEDREGVRLLLKNYGLERPYFLMVSCDIGRKNTLGLLDAFRIYLNDKNSCHDLVLVWSNPPKAFLEQFASEIEFGRIHFLKNVDDHLLRILYNGATASFFPSLYEGFGLPVLESMACGTPVVTCNNSSLKEAGGEAALYTNPYDLEQMAQFMTDFETKALDRNVLSDLSIKHAASFSWSNTAQEYLKFYKSAID